MQTESRAKKIGARQANGAHFRPDVSGVGAGGAVGAGRETRRISTVSEDEKRSPENCTP